MKSALVTKTWSRQSDKQIIIMNIIMSLMYHLPHHIEPYRTRGKYSVLPDELLASSVITLSRPNRLAYIRDTLIGRDTMMNEAFQPSNPKSHIANAGYCVWHVLFYARLRLPLLLFLPVYLPKYDKKKEKGNEKTPNISLIFCPVFPSFSLTPALFLLFSVQILHAQRSLKDLA